MVKFPTVMTACWEFIKSFHGLTRRIQTTVEHMRVTNTTTNMVRGEVIALTAGQRQAVRADADAEATARWAGVMCEPTPSLATGIARINGNAYVLFEAGLNPVPAAGEAAYVSTVAGRATNTLAGPWGAKIGIIADASQYLVDGSCKVYLQQCCSPFAPV